MSFSQHILRENTELFVESKDDMEENLKQFINFAYNSEIARIKF
jgi:hypothetical protein